MPKTSKIKKHPSELTTEEALNHLFHPKVVRHVKEIAANSKNPNKKATTR